MKVCNCCEKSLGANCFDGDADTCRRCLSNKQTAAEWVAKCERKRECNKSIAELMGSRWT